MAALRQLRSVLVAVLQRLRTVLMAGLGRVRPVLVAAVARLRALYAAHPRRVVGGAVAAVVVLAAASVALTRDTSEPTETAEPSTTTTTTTTAPPTTTTTVPPPPVAPLTGLTGNFQGRIDRPALIVKIDNVERARPHAGINRADIVIEEPVEGDLTRLAAVFHSTDAPEVGPVRSMRTTDLELVPLFGRPLFAASGGNGGVVPQIQAANVVDIGHHVSAEGFVRNPGRPAPHNLFTSTPALYGKSPESPPPPPPLFTYLAPGEALPGAPIPVGGIALRFGGPEVSRFTWDAASRTWPRSQRGSPHVVTTGEGIAPANVVVLEIAYDMSNQLGRSVPHGLVTGQGRAILLTQGQAVQGTWSRPSLGEPLRLVAANGQPMKLTPGQTFIELPVPGGSSFI